MSFALDTIFTRYSVCLHSVFKTTKWRNWWWIVQKLRFISCCNNTTFCFHSLHCKVFFLQTFNYSMCTQLQLVSYLLFDYLFSFRLHGLFHLWFYIERSSNIWYPFREGECVVFLIIRGNVSYLWRKSEKLIAESLQEKYVNWKKPAW